MNDELIEKLNKKANVIRRHIIKMLAEAGSGHPGGSLSCADILTCLYFHKMKHNPKEPSWEDRDRFVLSKGHAAPALYSCLAEAGYFSTHTLQTLRKLGSPLQGHPDCKKVPGVEISTGSLGQGLSIACGIAKAAKIKNKNFHTYVLLGDGECQEGQIWEAAMSASHFKLNNLTAIVDRNYLQIDGNTEKVMTLDALEDKFSSFGWEVKKIDGHNIKEILEALNIVVKEKPLVIIAKTVKGKGVSFMENKAEWHGKAPNKEQRDVALKELGEN